MPVKMKKINLFTPKWGRNSDTQTTNPPQTGDTLHRIVNAKEEARRRWEEEQELFDQRRREHEHKLVELEKAEVTRREEEIRKKTENLSETRRKNRLVQDTVAEQIKSLQQILEDYRLQHKTEEETLEDIIAGLEDKLIEVKSTLESRIEALQTEEKMDLPPSAPHVDVEDDCGTTGTYPTLPVPQARTFLANLNRISRPGSGLRLSSQGSSPNGSSSRSLTPKNVDQFDETDTSV